MARARVPKGQVFVKKEEKILKTLSNLEPVHSDEDFILRFQELHFNDWQKIVARYEAHEKNTPKGKSHPMPKPEQYLLNISHKLRTAYAKGEELNLAVEELESEN